MQEIGSLLRGVEDNHKIEIRPCGFNSTFVLEDK
jgi:hypothetical protein